MATSDHQLDAKHGLTIFICAALIGATWVLVFLYRENMRKKWIRQLEQAVPSSPRLHAQTLGRRAQDIIDSKHKGANYKAMRKIHPVQEETLGKHGSGSNPSSDFYQVHFRTKILESFVGMEKLIRGLEREEKISVLPKDDGLGLMYSDYGQDANVNSLLIVDTIASASQSATNVLESQNPLLVGVKCPNMSKRTMSHLLDATGKPVLRYDVTKVMNQICESSEKFKSHPDRIETYKRYMDYYLRARNFPKTPEITEDEFKEYVVVCDALFKVFQGLNS
eukprot:CAMPEP_0184694006 /NCGR_PEP_ID=MMETSP0313-20130426/2085_1 /TAXON_ID=2792 /ORGANISM="Porphyridium aerugineum, Strain SAG 1380-2" /LENGTH=278 /DNA_ID=CAMNT_0027152213 /DNA_START=28 /DNA_END=864 /DNA_ORIENTATION=+